MALPASGQISLSQVNVELGLSATAQISLNGSAVRTLFGKSSGAISLNDGHGKANRVVATVTVGSATTDYVLNPSKISGYIAGITDVNFVVNSGVVIGSSSTASAALSISGFTSGDTLVVINNGYIVGRGGNGGNGSSGPGGVGGLALSVSYPTKVTNNGIIGGGGGGGGAGAGHYWNVGSQATPNWITTMGDGGGGGAGYIAGSGGTGSQPGIAGSLTAGGVGGVGGGTNGMAYSGASGGGLGSAGGAPADGGGGGSGGGGGACTSGNSNITWLATGSRYGALN